MPINSNIPVDLANKLFNDRVIVIAEPIADYRHCLYQSELELVKDVSEKRLLEFTTGRDCAHQALHKMGYEICPILKGEQREPLWPTGIVGSISHCRDLAGAAIADQSRILSVGLDIENHKQLNPDIARHVCTADEQNWISSQTPHQQNIALLLIFSIKEAVFKCIYQITQYSLQFKQCRVVPDFTTLQAEVIISAPTLDLSALTLSTRFYFNATHVFSGAHACHLPAVG